MNITMRKIIILLSTILAAASCGSITDDSYHNVHIGGYITNIGVNSAAPEGYEDYTSYYNELKGDVPYFLFTDWMTGGKECRAQIGWFASSDGSNFQIKWESKDNVPVTYSIVCDTDGLFYLTGAAVFMRSEGWKVVSLTESKMVLVSDNCKQYAVLVKGGYIDEELI